MAGSLISLPFHLAVALVLVLQSLEGALANNDYLTPGFHFDYDKPNQLLPIPVTSQCEQIHLTWSRGGNDTGPLPVAPYFMQVFTSTNSTPFVIPAGFGPSFDWQVPFLPNTQYQICMFDVNGVSGGCQATYSVVATSNTTATSCQGPAAPSALSVFATVPLGVMTQYSYIDQCTTLTVSPQTGSPPYTLTVAPDSHPPYNITSNSKDAIAWKVSLPVGFKFFLSLESADGLVWANGPLTVGGLGPNSCLSTGMISQSFANRIYVGATMAGTVFGLVVGIIGAYAFIKFQNRRRAPSQLYFAGTSLARDSPAILKVPGTFAPSVIAASSYLPPSPTGTSIPLMPATPASRSTEALATVPPLPPLRPLTPQRRTRSNRQRSADLLASSPPSEIGSTIGSTTTSQYPADVKRPLPVPDISLISRDDAMSLASSSSHARTNPRPLSTHSRAPTYVPRSTPLRGAEHTIDETDAPEMPPEYGRHTNDPSLNYAPSVLSSGYRF